MGNSWNLNPVLELSKLSFVRLNIILLACISSVQCLLFSSQRDSLGSGDHNINEQLEGTHMATVTINDLYLMMSREFEGLEEVPAGNVLGMFKLLTGSIEPFFIRTVCYRQPVWLIFILCKPC